MRLLMDTLIAVMLAAILGGVLLFQQKEEESVSKRAHVQESLTKLNDRVAYFGALGEVATTPGGYPLLISPKWFGNALPTNRLVPSTHPWMDVAPLGDMSSHPPDPVIHHESQASFWYNPNLGVVRARVLPAFSNRETTATYNEVNGVSVAMVRTDRSEARRPQPLPIVIANNTEISTVGNEPPRPTLVDKNKRPSLRDTPAPASTDDTNNSVEEAPEESADAAAPPLAPPPPPVKPRTRLGDSFPALTPSAVQAKEKAAALQPGEFQGDESQGDESKTGDSPKAPKRRPSLVSKPAEK